MKVTFEALLVMREFLCVPCDDENMTVGEFAAKLSRGDA